mmetsp:Transcript_15291/g.29635  ORF Transcript_15291/g.29635 Transcript_15291/m.29635 type:complete len:542 (-) Transcript_15291:103-1728(-)
MQMRTWVASALVVALAATGYTNAADNCNVESSGDSVTIISESTFSTSEIKLIGEKLQITDDGVLNLIESDTAGGFVNQAWYREQYRLADGFQATIDFQIDGYVDGFSFVIQNDDIDNVMGGAASSLAFVNSLTKYLGIGFVACRDFDSSCGGPNVTVYTYGADDSTYTLVAGAEKADMDAMSFVSDEPYQATILYSAYDQSLTVSVGPVSGDQVQVISTTIESLEDILDSRYGYMGFGGSVVSLGSTTGSMNITSLDVIALPSDTFIESDLGETINWGLTYIFTLARRNSCGETIDFDEVATNETYPIWANLTNMNYVTANNLTDTSDYTLNSDYYEPVSITYNDGMLDIRFDLPNQVSADWQLSVEYNGVPAANMPYDGAVYTKEPSGGKSLPTWGLALLIVLIVLIVLGLIYAVWRLKRYRNKLKENEENIEAGKEKARLDALDHEVEYSVNPMLGTPEEMKRKLAENERELERLRNGKDSRFDDARTIEDLQKQNAALREEMNKLKREAQQEEALKTTYTTMQAPAKSDRKEYGPGRA